MTTAHDKSYQTGFYVKQGGQEVHHGNQAKGPDGTGASMVLGARSAVAAVQWSITNAAGGGDDIAIVTFQAQDGLGNNVADVFNFDLWLSDDATAGAGLTATTASGAVTVSTAGAVIGTYTSKKALRVQTDATGLFNLTITDTGETAFVPCMQIPTYDITQVGTAITTYG